MKTYKRRLMNTQMQANDMHGEMITLLHEEQVVGRGPCAPLPQPFSAYTETAHVGCPTCSGPHGCVYESESGGRAYGYVLAHTADCPKFVAEAQPQVAAPPPSKPYEKWLHARLREPELCCGYLLAHITPQDGIIDKELLAIALRDIAAAYSCQVLPPCRNDPHA